MSTTVTDAPARANPFADAAADALGAARHYD